MVTVWGGLVNYCGIHQCYYVNLDPDNLRVTGIPRLPVVLTAHDSAEEDIHRLSDTFVNLSLTVQKEVVDCV